MAEVNDGAMEDQGEVGRIAAVLDMRIGMLQGTLTVGDNRASEVRSKHQHCGGNYRGRSCMTCWTSFAGDRRPLGDAGTLPALTGIYIRCAIAARPFV